MKKLIAYVVEASALKKPELAAVFFGDRARALAIARKVYIGSIFLTLFDGEDANFLITDRHELERPKTVSDSLLDVADEVSYLFDSDEKLLIVSAETGFPMMDVPSPVR